MLRSLVLDALGQQVIDADFERWLARAKEAGRLALLDRRQEVSVATVVMGRWDGRSGRLGAMALYASVVDRGWLGGYEEMRVEFGDARLCHADLVAEVEASQRLSVLRQDGCREHAARLGGVAFREWATDHLRGPVRQFRCLGHAPNRLLGFSHEEDRAVFVLSPWHAPC